MTDAARRHSGRVSDVAIIGCGIVGLSIAHQLQARGLGCLLIDPRGPAGGASFGNLGAVAAGNLMPQSGDYRLGDVLHRLFEPLSALKPGWAAVPSRLHWLWRFARQANATCIQVSLDATHRINRLARRAWHDLAEATDLTALIAQTGYLQVYSEDAYFEHMAPTREQMRLRDVPFDLLDARQLHEFEPALSRNLKHGVLQPDALFLRAPDEFCRRLFNRLCARGADTLISDALAIIREGAGYRVSTLRGDVHVDQVVLAAGAWSNDLLRDWGVRLPMVAMQGGHLSYPVRSEMARPVHWMERRLLLSPMASGVRAGTLGGLVPCGRSARPGPLQARHAHVQQVLPALSATPSSQWCSASPCTPDSLPLLGWVPGERIFVATGHGQLGLTQAPVTADWVARLMTGESVEVDLSPYRLDRFQAGACA